MSTKYKHGDVVPSEVLSARLLELAHAATKSGREFEREFNMRIPAELDRDADLVLSQSADRIEQLQRERDELKAVLHEVHQAAWSSVGSQEHEEADSALVHIFNSTKDYNSVVAEIQAKAVEDAIESIDDDCDDINRTIKELQDYAAKLRGGE